MAKELDIRNSKLALRQANSQTILTTAEKNFPEILDMRGEVSAEDEDVVHIHKIEWKVWSGIWSIKS